MKFLQAELVGDRTHKTPKPQPTVELPEKRFTNEHLAQLKYVLPEAILIKKVLVHDEVSCCMKPELQVSLQIDAVEENTKQNGESGYSLLRKVFIERLVDFSKEHPEEDDIPESELLEETPVKHVSTPARLMTSTPEILAPKRNCSTSMVDSPPIKKRAIRTRLFQTPTKSVKTEDEELEAPSPSIDNDVTSFLPEALLRSIREKEKKTLMKKEAGAASAKRREKMKSSLPDTFNLIRLLFQSRNTTFMTKPELIHKIIMYDIKIVDRSEVEEQLKLLQEIVPDWISENIAPSGDPLFCVNQICDPEEIRQRLAEAE